jgi:CHAD domain-containing protein
MAAFRRDVFFLRTLLDLSAPAFPQQKGKGNDPFGEMRRELDAGYEALGAYKDLYATQLDGKKPRYDAAVLAARQKKLVSWRKRMTPERVGAWRDFFENVPEARAETPPRNKQVSKHYWGDLRPQPDVDGLGNLRLLSEDLAERAAVAMRGLGELRKLGTPAAEKSLHDARKSIRSLLSLHQLYPELSSGKEARSVESLREIVKQLGDVHDPMEGVLHAKSGTPAHGKQVAKLEKAHRKYLRFEERANPQKTIAKYLAR